MSISEKYRKVLEAKKLTIFKAEQLLGFGRNTLTMAIDGNRLLSPRFQQDFIEKFHVEPTWWETGKGEIFTEKLTSVSEPEFRIEKGEKGNRPE